MVSLKDTDLTSKELAKKTVAAFEALQPLLTFITAFLPWIEAIGDDETLDRLGDAILELCVGFVQLLIKNHIVERDRKPAAEDFDQRAVVPVRLRKDAELLDLLDHPSQRQRG